MSEDLSIAPLLEQGAFDEAVASGPQVHVPPGGLAGLIAFVSLAQMVMGNDTAVLSEVLPAISRDLAASPGALAWVAAAFSLSFAGLLMLGGRFTDLFGQRRCCIAGLCIFALGALGVALSVSAWTLVAARAIQGLGMALLAPANFSLLNTGIPPGPIKHRALGIYGAVQGAALVTGFLGGGALTTLFSWRAAEFASVPLALGVAVLGWRVVPAAEEVARGRKLDLLGAALVTTATVLLVWSLSSIQQSGWLSRGPWELLVLGLIAFAVFFFVESRAETPLLPLKVFRQKDVVGANVVILFAMAGAGGFFLLPNMYLQQVLHFSAASAGLAMMPQAVASILAARFVPLAAGRVSLRTGMVISTSVFLAGLLLCQRLSGHGDYLTALMPASVIGICGSLVTAVLVSAAATANVEASCQGVATALLFTTQQIGMALGISISVSAVGGHAAGADALTVGLRHGFAASAVLGGLAVASAALLLGRLPRMRAPRRQAVAGGQGAL